ncbi:MAG: GldG family protein [Clostridia bacterium]|nr:GldG family protein [Clostridia bacterium]
MMEENKKINSEVEGKKNPIAGFFKKFKLKRKKLIKNQALLKRGSYSLVITVMVIVAAIVVNIVTGALNDRFVLEFDMTADKNNSINIDNIEFIKNIKDKVNITVCSAEENYSSYMGYFAQQYNVNDEEAYVYYDQTVKLINKYDDYNKNITIEFIDPQLAEFSKITEKYGTDGLAYGDIIIECEKDGKAKHKIVGFEDIYSLYEDTSGSMYGYTFSTVEGNKIETALSGAIDFVTSDKTKKVAVITGHSSTDYTKSYLSMLKENNYEYTLLEDKIVNGISADYDAVIIPCPSRDFIGSELDGISEFLDNDGKLGKGLIFIADATAPYLPELYDFLEQWGIAIDEGILFATDTNHHLPEDPTTLGSYALGEDDMLKGMQLCLSGVNVPMYAAFESDNGIKTQTLMGTAESTVAAPKGTKPGWNGADKYEGKVYSTVIEAVKEDYDDDNNPIMSYVTAFSSSDFLESEYNEYPDFSNKEIVFAVSERAVGEEESDISFVSKQITNEYFTVTEDSAELMRTIFMIILPILTIIAAIVVYFRRKNS